MKKFLTIVAFLSAVASPAFAQEGAWSRTYRQTPTYNSVYGDKARDRNGAYAYEPGSQSYDPNVPSCAGDLGYGRPDYSSC
jgi:hypothetical protein